MEPGRPTIKRLYALSQNRCAFPECPLPIVEPTGTVTGHVCHIRARSPEGPRFDPSQTEVQRHAFENLVLMCARHSKVIDSEPGLYTVGVLEAMKRERESPAANDLTMEDGRNIDRLAVAYRDCYILATKVYIERVEAGTAVFHSTTERPPSVAAPEGAIGSDLLRRNYAKHLIDRYNHYASKQPGRSHFVFPAVYSMVQKRYGVKRWELIPMDHFEDLCVLLRSSIDKTWLGCVNRGKGRRNYSSFEEYRVKYFERAARPPRRRKAS